MQAVVKEFFNQLFNEQNHERIEDEVERAKIEGGSDRRGGCRSNNRIAPIDNFSHFINCEV